MKKKILAFLLSVLMVVGSCATILVMSVSAAVPSNIVFSADEITLDESATSATIGVWITGVTDEDDLGGINIKIGYDTSKIRVTKYYDTTGSGKNKVYYGASVFNTQPSPTAGDPVNPFVVLAWTTEEENLLLDSEYEINDMEFCFLDVDILGDWTGTMPLTVSGEALRRSDDASLEISFANGFIKRGADAHVHSGGTATCSALAICEGCGEAYGELDPTNHVNTTDVAAVASTCTVAGHAAYTICNDCGTVISGSNADLPLAAHTPADTYTSDENNHWKICTVCEQIIEDTVAAHTGGTATCTDPAICEVCGQSYGDVDADNHGSISDDWSSDATQHWHACGCGNKIDLANHTLTETVGAEYLKSEATCSSGAVYYKHCSVCGYVSTTDTFVSGEPDASKHVGGTATCSSQAICTECGQPYGELDPDNHSGDPGTWEHNGTQHWKICTDCSNEIVRENHTGGTATCSSKAVCDVCGAEYGDYDANNHSFTQEVATNDYLASPATCISPATYYKSCTCGAAGTETFTYGDVDPENHVNTTDVAAQASTCTVAGHAAYTVCNDCGNVISGSDADLPLADHAFAEIVSEEHKVSEATCQSPAVYKKSCSECGFESDETFTSGDPDPNNHVNVGEDWFFDEFEHWHVCSDCSQIVQGTRDEHIFGDWEIQESDSRKFRVRTCTVCGGAQSEEVSDLVDGDAGKYQSGGTSGLSFTVPEGSAIGQVVVDGVVVDPENYDVSEDGTSITLKPEFLDTLGDGEHNIDLYISDDQGNTSVAPGTFSVAAAEEPEAPVENAEKADSLGDESTMFIYMAAMALSLGCLAAIVTNPKHKKRNIH